MEVPNLSMIFCPICNLDRLIWRDAVYQEGENDEQEARLLTCRFCGYEDLESLELTSTTPNRCTV